MQLHITAHEEQPECTTAVGSYNSRLQPSRVTIYPCIHMEGPAICFVLFLFFFPSIKTIQGTRPTPRSLSTHWHPSHLAEVRAKDDFGAAWLGGKVLQGGAQEPHAIGAQRTLAKLVYDAQRPAGTQARSGQARRDWPWEAISTQVVG